jgi:hypothetical protein
MRSNSRLIPKKRKGHIQEAHEDLTPAFLKLFVTGESGLNIHFRLQHKNEIHHRGRPRTFS